MSAPSEMSQLQAHPQQWDNQQFSHQKMLHETIKQQQMLISILKQQIHKLQNQAIQKQKILLEKQKLLNQALQLIDVQKQKIQTLKQNNQSIIHTFEIFQRQFVKRDYKNGNVISLPQQIDKNVNSDGPFFLQLIRNMKKKISDGHIVQPIKKEQNLQQNQYYGYFLNQQLDQKQTLIFNQTTQKKLPVNVIKQKVRSFGKKNYFNQKHRYWFWFYAMDKGLRITRQYYEDLVLKSESLKQNQKQRKVSLIDRDLCRMDLKIDDEKQKNIKNSIRKCLQTFQVYRPDVGYIQGMSYLAWMFLVRMEDYKAFSCFSNLILCDEFVYNLYFFKEVGIKKIKEFYEKCMEQRRNKIFKHMKNLEVQCQFFIIQWAYTMFTRAFSLRISSKIWDLWLSEGYNVFFRVVLVIMDLLETQILQTNQNQKVIQILRTQTHKLNQAQFLRGLRRQRLSQQLEF